MPFYIRKTTQPAMCRNCANIIHANTLKLHFVHYGTGRSSTNKSLCIPCLVELLRENYHNLEDMIDQVIPAVWVQGRWSR